MNAVEKLHGARILLVEDLKINQLVVFELLTDNDIDVTIAENGKEALALLEQKTFAGVLMDCDMPVMDGYETTWQLRKNEMLKDLPVLAMTVSGSPCPRLSNPILLELSPARFI